MIPSIQTCIGNIILLAPERSLKLFTLAFCFGRVNPLGKYFGHLKTSDLLLVDMHGNIVRGNRTASKAVLMIHGTIQRMRSDVVCTVHA